MSALIVNGSGSVYVERCGPVVELNLLGVQPSGSPAAALTQLFGSSGFPLGFRPARAFSVPMACASAPLISTTPRLYLTTGGRCDTNNPGVASYALVSYLTHDDWPTDLPGSAV